jgi:hypothetical protein
MSHLPDWAFWIVLGVFYVLVLSIEVQGRIRADRLDRILVQLQHLNQRVGHLQAVAARLEKS